MQKVVLDTNILVSGMFCIAGAPAKILKLALEGKLSVCYNSKILLEYDDVLYRKRFNFDPKKVQNVISTITETGLELTPMPSNFTMADEDDRIFYDLYKATGAILITGNIKHFPKEELIMKPVKFMEYFLSSYITDD